MKLLCLSDLHLRSEAVVAAIDRQRLSPFLAQIAATVAEVSPDAVVVTGDTVSPAQVRLLSATLRTFIPADLPVVATELHWGFVCLSPLGLRLNSAPVVEVQVDALKAQAEGLTAADIGGAVSEMIGGVEATEIDVDGESITVNVEYADDEYDTMDKVENAVLSTPDGGSVALTDVADVHFVDSPGYFHTLNTYEISKKSGMADPVIGTDFSLWQEG